MLVPHMYEESKAVYGPLLSRMGLPVLHIRTVSVLVLKSFVCLSRVGGHDFPQWECQHTKILGKVFTNVFGNTSLMSPFLLWKHLRLVVCMCTLSRKHQCRHIIYCYFSIVSSKVFNLWHLHTSKPENEFTFWTYID